MRDCYGVLVGAHVTTTLLVPHREITKPLVPLGKATTLLVEVLGLLCKGMVSAYCSHRCQCMCWGWHREGVKPFCTWRGWRWTTPLAVPGNWGSWLRDGEQWH